MLKFKMYVALFAVQSFIMVLPETSAAKVCITRLSAGPSVSALELEDFGGQAQAYWEQAHEARAYQATLTCQELNVWQIGLRATSYTFSMSGLALACSAVGAPVGVTMLGVGAVIYSADLVVNSLPCDDGSTEKIERLVRQEVCQALKAQGIACDPQKLVRK